MANELTQIHVDNKDFDIKDAGASPTGHTHTSSWASSSHVHYMNSCNTNYNSWGTIATIASTNSTTSPFQLCSWGAMGSYAGYFTNKKAVSFTGIGTLTSNNGAYTITVTAARPYQNSGAILYKNNSAEVFQASYDGGVKLIASYGTGSVRTAAVGAVGAWFGGLVELNVSSLANAGKYTSAPA